MTVARQPEGARHVCSSFHGAWDRSLEPALEVDDGDVLELHVPDASRDQIGEGAVVADLASIDFDLMNPVAGPVFVRGAQPGDVLEVEVLEVRTRPWGWTAIVPGFGLLADDFPEPWLRISRIERGRVLFGDRSELPCRPFPGTIGVAPESPGPHSVIPPSRFGGNIDVRHLIAGATLFLPVGVEGALFSAGDGHAAQGDGEVCGSAIETGMEIAVRLGVRRDIRVDAPQLLAPSLAPAAEGPVHVATGVAEDLHGAARGAARAMIERLSGFGLSPEEAYALLSVAGDLRIHEIVNAPRWVVGMALPDAVLAR
jgi:acetamidase/formamidase